MQNSTAHSMIEQAGGRRRHRRVHPTHTRQRDDRHKRLLLLLPLLVLLALARPCPAAAAAAAARQGTDRAALAAQSRELAAALERHRPQLYDDLVAADAEPQRSFNRNPDLELAFIDDRGHPVFYGVHNADAAATIATAPLWPGGGSGFGLSGAGTAPGRLAVWDAGGVRLTHQEFGGRVAQVDAPGGTHWHATHVAGTMVAAGVNAAARGMSYQASLDAYDWQNDGSEMAAAAAAGLQVSNHSYGFVVGWQWDSFANPHWVWWGDLSVNSTEDYRFGFYDSSAQSWDQMAANAPFYAIVKSAGNDHGEGPAAGTQHWHWDPQQGGWVLATDTHAVDGAGGFDCLPPKGNAKNVITVGAVADIPGGWTQPGDVQVLGFSSRGPTDDGRIKPDLVANGDNLFSTDDASDFSYQTLSGTSMATPSAAGSINLLARYYEATHAGAAPRSATLRAVLVQTADEAGAAAGPDYTHGWGLVNTHAAVRLIQADSAQALGRVVEATLADGATDTYVFDLPAGGGPVRLTLAWTDPAGTPPPASLDPATAMLVDDLDLRLARVGDPGVFEPWVLDPSNPSAAATAGDNVRDNIEQVWVANAAAGSYQVTVTHKGTLAALQDYALASSQPLALPPPPPLADFDDHDAGNLVLTMTDQGSLGFMDDTQAQGSGFVFPAAGSNLLYIGGLWVAQGENYVANRDYAADPAREWVVAQSPDGHVVEETGGAADQVLHAGYTDDGASNPIDFYIRQESWAFSSSPDDDFVIVRYFIHNRGTAALSDLRAGVFLDFDLGDFTQNVGGTDAFRRLGYLTEDGGSGVHAGVQFLRDAASPPVSNLTLIHNPTYVWPNAYVLDADKFGFLRADSSYVLPQASTPDDYSLLVAVGPFGLAAGDSTEVSFAIVGGTSLADLQANADRAQYLVNPTVGVGEPVAAAGPGALGLPVARLLPNVPNPFNPATTVRFELAAESPVKLAVYSAAGRLVRTLAEGRYAPGAHALAWEGTRDGGGRAASGVYFLRLAAGDVHETRRMVLVK